MELLYTNLTQIYRTLETLERLVSACDNFFVHAAVQRLDSESVRAWEHYLGSSKEPPTWTQFTEFLFTRLHSLQAFEKSRGGKSAPPASAKAHFHGKPSIAGSSNISCPLCSSNHYLASCSQYSAKNTQQRLALISKYKLCHNCLGSHRVSACRVGKRCLKCGRKHHTSIHPHHTKTTGSSSNTPHSTEPIASTSASADKQI